MAWSEYCLTSQTTINTDNTLETVEIDGHNHIRYRKLLGVLELDNHRHQITQSTACMDFFRRAEAQMGGWAVAESMIVHFSSAGWGELEQWMDAHAVRIDHRRWNHPVACEPLLFAYEYADHRSEFEPEDMDRLCGLLGGYPSAALCFQLRRGLGDRSCDAAAVLTAKVLRSFTGVADDTFADGGEGYWSLAELEVGTAKPHGRFLDCYRTGR